MLVCNLKIWLMHVMCNMETTNSWNTTHTYSTHSYCIHYKKWLVVLTTEWLSWLQASWGGSGYEMFILVLKANCISNLNPNHSLHLRTLEHLWLQLHFKMMLLWWLSHRCLVNTISTRSCIGYWMLFDKSRCDPFTDVQWLLYQQDRGCKIVWETSSMVVLCN